MTPCQLCKVVQTDRSDGLCGPCRMGSVASEHVPRPGDDSAEKSMKTASSECTPTDCYCDYLASGEHCRRLPRPSDAPTDEPDDVGQQEEWEVSDAEDGGYCARGPWRVTIEEAARDIPAAHRIEPSDEVPVGWPDVTCSFCGHNGKFGTCPECGHPVPTKEGRSSEATPSLVEAVRKYVTMVEEDEGDVETFCARAEGEYDVMVTALEAAEQRSETAPACLAPDVECKAEPKWSGRCGEHYWRMVAGQEPGHPPPRLPNDLAADPGMWTCKCGRRQKDCPCFNAGAEAGHAVGVKVGSEERGRPTATDPLRSEVENVLDDLIEASNGLDLDAEWRDKTVRALIAARDGGQKPKLHEPRAASGEPPGTVDDTRRTEGGGDRSVAVAAERSGDRFPLGASASASDREARFRMLADAWFNREIGQSHYGDDARESLADLLASVAGDRRESAQAKPEATATEGVTRIARERQRQIDKLGWTPEHDDEEHDGGQLAMAAACYAAPEQIYVRSEYANGVRYDDPFPWNNADARPFDGNVLTEATDAQRLRLLEKAGALIAAEIDRMLRAADSSGDPALVLRAELERALILFDQIGEFAHGEDCDSFNACENGESDECRFEEDVDECVHNHTSCECHVWDAQTRAKSIRAVLVETAPRTANPLPKEK
jgi:hypothetical protein